MNDASIWECPHEYTIGGMSELIMREMRRNNSYAGLSISTPDKVSAARGRQNALRAKRRSRING